MLALDKPEFFREILDHLLTGVYVLDTRGKVMLWNVGAERITGYLGQDVVGHFSPADVLLIADTKETQFAGDATPVPMLWKDGKSETVHVSLLHKAGHRIPARLHSVPLRDASNAVIGAVGSFSEYLSSDEFYPRESKLERYGCLDSVSGVLNHGMVEAHLREALAMFSEHPVPFSILCIGIDGVESIRARLGHAAIDSVVRVVGQTIENSLRPSDFIGRWLDTEFLAILTECSEQEVQSVANRMQRMVHQAKVEWWGDPLQVSISTGAASAQIGDSATQMVNRAENLLRQQLLKEKSAGPVK